jgi:hypothetical protein
MIAIPVVLSTCVTAFAGLYPAQNAEGRDTGAAYCACIIGQDGFTSQCPVKKIAARGRCLAPGPHRQPDRKQGREQTRTPASATFKSTAKEWSGKLSKWLGTEP